MTEQNYLKKTQRRTNPGAQKNHEKNLKTPLNSVKVGVHDSSTKKRFLTPKKIHLRFHEEKSQRAKKDQNWTKISRLPFGQIFSK